VIDNRNVEKDMILYLVLYKCVTEEPLPLDTALGYHGN